MAKRKFFYIFYLLQVSALLAVLIPFLRSNNLTEWDFPGHYAAIWHVKHNLFPWPTGWNPYFYCGYPQGIFYPPLGHYLAALLSFPLGIEVAIKLLIAASLLALPVSFYIFAWRWGLDDLQAAVCATWMTAVLFLSGDLLGVWTLGSDLKSILNVGLFANALSLPILFAFLATCGRGIGKNRWKTPALLLGVLFLLHPLSVLIAGVFSAAIGLDGIIQCRRQNWDWKPLLLTLTCGILIGAYWIVPFMSYRAYMNPEFVGAQWSSPIQFVVLNGVILALSCFSKPLVRPLSLAFLMLANFILIGTVGKLELQFTRLTVYLLFILPVFLLVWVRSRVVLGALAVLALCAGIQGYRHSGINPAGVPEFPLPNFGAVSGRVLSVSPHSLLPSFHVNHDLIPPRTGNFSVLGLFIESSFNGRFQANLMRTLDPGSYFWGTPTEPLTPQELGNNYPGYVADRLRLFDIRHVYTNLKLEELLDPSLAQKKKYINSYPIPNFNNPQEMEIVRKRYNTHDSYVDFYLYPVGLSTLAEPLSYVPRAPGTDWKSTTVRWFLGMRGVPIFTDRTAPPGVRGATQGETVELVEASPRMDRLVLQIEATQDIPVLVKMGYFPTWELSVNGRSASIYRASPNLILIFGHGRAVLEYRRPWQEYLGLALCILGLGLVLFYTNDP